MVTALLQMVFIGPDAATATRYRTGTGQTIVIYILLYLIIVKSLCIIVYTI